MRRLKLVIVAASMLSLAGCGISIEENNRAIMAIDSEWASENHAIFENEARRNYAVDSDVAFTALNAAFVKLSLQVRQRDRQSGALIGRAVAPRPLSDAEWRAVSEIELPRVKEVVSREVGPVAGMVVTLSPSQYFLQFAASVTGDETRAQIAFTGRMASIAPIRGYYYNEFMPPEALRRGVEKIWAAFETELRAQGVEPRQIPRQAAPSRRSNPGTAL